MNKNINNIKNTRLFLLNEIKDLQVDELNEIPPGFNNNIIWNLGHMVAAQQGVCYLRAGLALSIEEKCYIEYKPGTRPLHLIDLAEVQKIKNLLLSTVDQLENDTEMKLFTNYKTWTTRYGGIELSSIDEAISFLLFHEGLHTGVISSLKKMVTK